MDESFHFHISQQSPFCWCEARVEHWNLNRVFPIQLFTPALGNFWPDIKKVNYRFNV